MGAKPRLLICPRRMKGDEMERARVMQKMAKPVDDEEDW